MWCNCSRPLAPSSPLDRQCVADELNIPDFYLPLLVQYLQANPYDTNFIVEFAEKGKPSRGGNGFGAITCKSRFKLGKVHGSSQTLICRHGRLLLESGLRARNPRRS
jgi:hypothetical protein